MNTTGPRDFGDLHDAEQALVSGRWGDSAQVLEQAVQWYRAAGADDADVRTLRLHPVAHYAAVLHHDRDADDLLHAGAITARMAPRQPHDLLADWAFTGSEPDNVLESILQERIRGCSIVEPTEGQRADLVAAIALLDQVLPDASRDALSYVARVVLTDDPARIGETMRDLPTVVIFGPGAFVDRKALAESLFHEALHTKTIISERSAMLARDDQYERDEVIVVPWRDDDDDDRTWPLCRAFMAYYVYAHLTVLWVKFWEMDHSTRDLDMLRRVCFRAAYLSSQLRNQPPPGLGAACREMMDWLDAVRIPPFDLTPTALEMITAQAGIEDVRVYAGTQ
ncbi:Uncharacterised protein [Mycobacteroides abscessus subsp. abscessus]|uniref:hypothetical protein n=1 Tax=Mycobacteroides abscessus TaxID=36809 RepID=UPI0005DECE49|nr:hypothetical protein [Mycobacteroides abscessus]CPV55541.1 Uncharacterised protein [Mycobacteroides abscessus]SHQ64500.1 Uncharacterised protein [Mycobacteroides abscessus subsp. abscessus]SHR32946.1 Uncharacterised protein [Mycobacteroides abscessus subsp. abscessus]SHZ30346.1 Uncharacterised protein [Mycobacteroides abscessus subsp. abscessus]SKE49601.1 Uncharacterised protein [Mycobacteroides abscessus subsp. abscessus]